MQTTFDTLQRRRSARKPENFARARLARETAHAKDRFFLRLLILATLVTLILFAALA